MADQAMMLDEALAALGDESSYLNFSSQQAIMMRIAALLAILLAPIQIWRTSQNPTTICISPLFWVKFVFTTGMVGAEIASFNAWTSLPEFRSDTAVASATLASVAAFTIAAVILYNHLHSFQACSVASLYLSASLVFDMVRGQIFTSTDEVPGFTRLSKYVAVSKFILILLEEFPKQSLIVNDNLRETVDPEKLRGFWNRALFVWLKSVVFTGYYNIKTYDDFPDLPPDCSSRQISGDFGKKWHAANKSSKYALVYVCYRAYFWQLTVIFVPRLLASIFTMLRPLLLQRIVTFVGQDTPSDERSGLVRSLILLGLGSALSRASATHMQNQFSAKLRSALIMEIFKKSLMLPHESAKESAAISLISTDIDDIAEGIANTFDIVVGVIEACAGVYLLTNFVQKAAWIAFWMIILAIILAIGLGRYIVRVRSAMNKETEARVAKASAALTQIKSLKMMGLKSESSSYIHSLRATEIKELKKLRYRQMYLTVSIVFIDIVSPILVIGAALFSTTWNGTLSPHRTFPTILIMCIITHPLMKVMGGYGVISSTTACFLRVQEYLLAPEVSELRIVGRNRDRSETVPQSPEKVGAQFHPNLAESSRNVTSQFDVVLSDTSVGTTMEGRQLLHNLSMSFRKSSFTIVLGPTGSGKTTFLRTLLGETFVSSGSVTIGQEQIAYCGQTPWIRKASIRDNIIAERPYDPVWYEVVTNACLLNTDLQRFPLGDRSPAGDNGNNLSGGQKHRVALARALFSRSPIIILDDILSALDAATASALFSRVFGEKGVIRRSSSTVFFATHSTDYLQAADQVVIIDKHGNATARRGLNRSSLARAFLDELSQNNTDIRNENGLSDVSHGLSSHSPGPEEPRVRETSGWVIYSYYFAPVSKLLLVAWFCAIVSTNLSEMAPDFYVRIWMEVAPNDTSHFPGLLVAGLSSCVFGLLQLVLIHQYIIPRAVEALHNKLVDYVFGASLHVLTSGSHAAILNKFSQDISLATVELPFKFLVTIYLGTFIILKSIIVAMTMKYAGPLVLGSMMLFLLTAKYYLRITRRVRFLDLEARSPLLAEFTEAAMGLEHIRAYRWQPRVISRAFDALDHSQKPFYHMQTMQRWLAFSVELLTVLLTLSVVAVAIYSSESVSESSLGHCSVLMITLNKTLINLVERFAALETASGAVSRIRDLDITTPQERISGDAVEVRESWPEVGEIVFANVTARYNPVERTRLALDNVSLRICAGETVGVIGRTGSGKSSMLLTLLNFLEHSGSITIDGVNVSRVPHEVLRDRITTVPQEPVELPGTVRDNLMPYKGEQDEPTLHDGLIDDVLGQIRLLDYVNARGGVDRPYADMGFSHGQQQLISIGRAMLHHMYKETKIILMDEPTSNMDNATDAIIQDLIRDEFIGCTVMVITHRKETIRDANMFVEFSNGRIVKVEEQRQMRETSLTPSFTTTSSMSSYSRSSYSRSSNPFARY